MKLLSGVGALAKLFTPRGLSRTCMPFCLQRLGCLEFLGRANLCLLVKRAPSMRVYVLDLTAVTAVGALFRAPGHTCSS